MLFLVQKLGSTKLSSDKKVRKSEKKREKARKLWDNLKFKINQMIKNCQKC